MPLGVLVKVGDMFLLVNEVESSILRESYKYGSEAGHNDRKAQGLQRRIPHTGFQFDLIAGYES